MEKCFVCHVETTQGFIHVILGIPLTLIKTFLTVEDLNATGRHQ